MYYRKLRGKLRELDIDQRYLGIKLDMCVGSVSARMTGATPWRLDEMYHVMDIINEPYDRLHEFFPRGGLCA